MSDITIRLGEYDFDETNDASHTDYKLVEAKMHEAYDPRTFDNDIAVLTLDRTVPFSKRVYPICLPPSSEAFTNRRAFVVGWGTIYFGGPTSSNVQEVNVRVWDNAECAKNYGELNRNVTGKMLCAGEVGRDACQVHLVKESCSGILHITYSFFTRVIPAGR